MVNHIKLEANHIKIEATDWEALNYIRVLICHAVVFRYVDGRFTSARGGWKSLKFDGEDRFDKLEAYIKKLSKNGIVWLKWNK